MKIFQHCVIALLTLMLVSCGGGGGGDSSSGADSSNGNTTVNLAQFAGTYVGNITATVLVNGMTESLTREITIVISSDGNTITLEGNDFSLNSDKFTETVAIPLTAEDVVCTLNATFTGTITFDLIAGNVTGSGNCVVSGTIVEGQLTGYSGAVRT